MSPAGLSADTTKDQEVGSEVMRKQAPTSGPLGFASGWKHPRGSENPKDEKSIETRAESTMPCIVINTGDQSLVSLDPDLSALIPRQTRWRARVRQQCGYASISLKARGRRLIRAYVAWTREGGDLAWQLAQRDAAQVGIIPQVFASGGGFLPATPQRPGTTPWLAVSVLPGFAEAQPQPLADLTKWIGAKAAEVIRAVSTTRRKRCAATACRRRSTGRNKGRQGS